MLSQEYFTAIATLSGVIGSSIIVLWKIFKVSKNFTDEHDNIKKCLAIIKGEVTPNGGGSIKDIICQLRNMVERIEIRQKIVDQRTKAILHHSNSALFETDKDGRLVWYNELFTNITRENGSLNGYDWFSMVDEELRENFINEVKSCLKMCRKIDIETTSINGSRIRFIGYPYRIGISKHEGFLIHLYLNGENK